MKHRRLFTLTGFLTVLSFLFCAGAHTLTNNTNNISSTAEAATIETVTLTNSDYNKGYLRTKNTYSITNGNSFVLQYHLVSDTSVAGASTPYPYRCFSPLAANAGSAWNNMVMYYGTGNFISLNALGVDLGAWDNFNRYVSDTTFRWVWNANGSVSLYVGSGDSGTNLTKYDNAVQAANFFDIPNLFNYTTSGYVYLMGNSYQGDFTIDSIKIGQAANSSATPTWLINNDSSIQANWEHADSSGADLITYGTRQVVEADGRDFSETFINDDETIFSTKDTNGYQHNIANGWYNVTNATNGSNIYPNFAYKNFVAEFVLKIDAGWFGFCFAVPSMIAGPLWTEGYGARPFVNLSAAGLEVWNIGASGKIGDYGATECAGISGKTIRFKIKCIDNTALFSLDNGNGTYQDLAWLQNVSTMGYLCMTMTEGCSYSIDTFAVDNLDLTSSNPTDTTSIKSFSVESGESYAGNVSATSAYGNSIRYYVDSNSASSQGTFTLNMTTGSYTFAASSTASSGDYTVVINLEDHGLITTCTITITISGGIDHIVINTASVKKQYLIGDDFDITGLTVRGYAGSTFRAIMSIDWGYQIDDGAMNSVGKHNCLVYLLADQTINASFEFEVFETIPSEDTPLPPALNEYYYSYQLGSKINVNIPVNFRSLPLESVKNGNNVLQASIDYLYSSDSIMLTKTYLESLLCGNNAITITTSAGSATFVLEILQAEIPEEDLTPTSSSSTITYVLGSSNGASVVLDLKGQNITTITLGDNTLTTTDYTFLDNRLIISSSYLNNLEADIYFLTVYTATGECIITLVVEENEQSAQLNPNITNPSATYVLGSATNITFTVDYKGSNLSRLSYNGEIIDPLNYSYTNSSITLKSLYLDNFDEGLYTFVLDSALGSAKFLINIVKTTEQSKVAPSVANAYMTFNKGSNADLSISCNLYGLDINYLTKDAYILTNGSINSGDYYLDGSVIKMRSAYLNDLDLGTYTFNLETDGGSVSYFVVIKRAQAAPTVEEPSMTFRKNNPEDVEFVVNLGGANITSITMDNGSITSNDYAIGGTNVTFYSSFLQTLDNGDYSFAITTVGGTVKVSIAVINGTEPTVLPEPPTIVGDAYMAFDINNKEDIVFEFSLHGEQFRALIMDGELLERGVDYVFDDANQTLTFAKEWLDSQSNTLTFTLRSTGGSVNFTIGIIEEQGEVIANGCVTSISTISFASIGLIALIGFFAYKKRKIDE